MADITLKLIINGDGSAAITTVNSVKSATSGLKQAATESGQAMAQTFKASGQAALDLSAHVSRLSGVFKTMAGGAAFTAVANMADTWSDLSSRVGLAVGAQSQAADVMERLSKVADDTYSSIETTTEAFLANNSVLSALGKTDLAPENRIPC
ncbi:tape measure protein [Sinimarinibacterium sp. NLF-5-8]|uniref:tape measure protein n=1 Tax=Sinimarinibacterium sp. NLF-5-8 TaxID=2698684 RepID=UPI00137BD199|nr:tape measure protein [Sinimarinibacterium sp. NLF-5-8]QHS10759.1 hypothetical protein GT972_11815 [Sinimarinibacterium sp. NLF-5-8]